MASKQETAQSPLRLRAPTRPAATDPRVQACRVSPGGGTGWERASLPGTRGTHPDGAAGRCLRRTASIAGGIPLDSAGQVMPGASLFVINAPTLRSYRIRPVDYVRSEPRETAAGFSPMLLGISGARGLPWPLPATGTARFQLTGDLSLNGVARPTTWTVAARFDHDKVTGKLEPSWSSTASASSSRAARGHVRPG